MLRGLTAKQFMEWEAFAMIEPFSELRDDYRFAALVQVLANANRGPKQPPYTLKECLLQFGEKDDEEKTPQQSRQTQMSVIQAIAMAYGAVKKEK